jgi:hypothetical protein
MLENLEYLRGHGGALNVSGRSQVLCVAGELDSGSGRTSFGISHGLYVMKVLKVGGTTYKMGQSSPIRLLFWVQLGPRPWLVGLR